MLWLVLATAGVLIVSLSILFFRREWRRFTWRRTAATVTSVRSVVHDGLEYGDNDGPVRIVTTAYSFEVNGQTFSGSYVTIQPASSPRPSLAAEHADGRFDVYVRYRPSNPANHIVETAPAWVPVATGITAGASGLLLALV